MASLSSGLNANVVRTALDKVFMQEFNLKNEHPQLADVSTQWIFKQDSIDRAAVITEIFKGSGLWGLKAEEADVPQATPRVGNQQTFTVSEYGQSIDITKNFFDDEQHNVYEKMVKDMAEVGRITQNQNAFAIYRNAFGSTLTNEGVALCSDTHTTLAGTTVDNNLTAALTEVSLNTAVVALMEQKAQDGTVRGQMPAVLLVPPSLYKKAVEITESELKSNTANNDMNVYSAKYGLMVYTSPYLGSAVVGGSDTAWFLLGKNHSITRWVRQGINTDLVDYKYQRNNNYVYKASFREVLGVMDYTGIVGSSGTV